MTRPAVDTNLLVPSARSPSSAQRDDNRVRTLRWTAERYRAAINAGLFKEDEPLELIDGYIIEKMPVGEPHADCLSGLLPHFILKFRKKYKFRAQDPIALADHDQPQPDFAVVEKKVYNRKTGHPQPDDIYLLIEIAQTSLDFDRTVKVATYAAAGIAEYWIINLRDRQVEVYLRPNNGTRTYASVVHYAESETFRSPFAGPTAVSELLPEETDEEEQR